jgi:hypothetical protein
MGITHTKVSTVADGSTTDHIRPTDWNADHAFSSNVALSGSTLSGGVLSSVSIVASTFAGNVAAGTTITNPNLKGTSTLPIATMTSNALLGTAVAGGLEYDGDVFYGSVGSSARGVIPTEQIITQTTAFTGTTAATAQKMFDASTGLNGAVTVGPSETYLFETNFTITGASTASKTHSFGFGGTAAVDRQMWLSLAQQVALTSIPSAPVITRATQTNIIHAAGTQSAVCATIRGKLVIGTSGTLIPQITRSAGTVALVTAVDSYFRIWPIGSSGVNRVGHWS